MIAAAFPDIGSPETKSFGEGLSFLRLLIVCTELSVPSEMRVGLLCAFGLDMLLINWIGRPGAL
jgi:hypothetical protein